MRNKPRIRFKGFTEDWEQRKLGNLATVEMNKRIFKEQTTTKGDIPFYKIGTFGSDADSFISRALFEEYKNKYPYPNIGDILISASGSIGRTVVYNGEDAYYQDSNIVWLNHNGQIDNSFLLQFYNQVKWAGLEGSTIKRLYNKNILETNIALPKVEEQRLIGKFFKLVDSSITLHQRKLEKLKLAKKALLQKLFPKNGSQFPEIRFKGFTDAWEQRKLGDFYTFKNGLNKEKVYFGYGDSIVNFTDVFHNRQIYSSTLKGKVFVNKKELENFRVKEGDLFFTRTSETIDEIGFPAVVMEPMERVVFSGFVLRGRAEKNDPLVNIFKSYIFFTDNFRSEMKKKSSMTTRALTSGTALKEMYFSYPKDLEEQTKIGEILLRLDNIITLHQCKLDKLQDVKKGLLQKMFV